MHIPDHPRRQHPSAQFRAACSLRVNAGGASLVEFTAIAPVLLFIILMLIQLGLLFHGKSQLNYATFEAARAGTVSNARIEAIYRAFARAMTGFHGGGLDSGELATSFARALAENVFARIEILSPAAASFDDYHSPALAARLQLNNRVIPNANLAFLRCPGDRPACNADPSRNRSGQTLADANLLKLRITYGIPPQKLIPLAGPFLVSALIALNPGDHDRFRRSLLESGRIPIVSHIVMRMQSPAIENGHGEPALPLPPAGPLPARPPSSASPPLAETSPPLAETSPSPIECTPANEDCSAGPATIGEAAQPDSPPEVEAALPCDPLLDPGCAAYPSCAAPADWLDPLPAHGD